MEDAAGASDEGGIRGLLTVRAVTRRIRAGQPFVIDIFDPG